EVTQHAGQMILPVIDKVLVYDQVALFVEGKYHLRTVWSKGAGAKVEVEDANLEKQPLVKLAYQALINNGHLVIGGESAHLVCAHRFIEKLAEAESDLAGLWRRAPAKTRQCRRRRGLRLFHMRLRFAKRADPHPILQ